MNARIRFGLAAVAVAVLGLSACGSDSLGGEPAADAPAPTTTQNVDLAAKLPENIKSAGVIKIGTDSTYPPNEFLAADGKTIEGFEVDIFNLVAQKFGVKTQWQSADFGSIITGVQGKKYDIGVSSFTINDERMKQVNMVSYYSAGTLWGTAQGNPKDVDPENPCGKTVAVQADTVQDTDDLPARQKKCGSNPIKILKYGAQDQATNAVVSGKADAVVSDSPVVYYAEQQTEGKLETLGEVYDSAPYGFAIPKEQTDFAEAIVQALKEIEADGSYKAALKKWAVEAGAISDFALNPTPGS
ncbi:MAG TPA: ABC transporter substrate-binding protein [Propionibacteriaceae bacterium]|nr:ABC transporter substrate-binding protein [Propionibacteriaceae bacterium]